MLGATSSSLEIVTRTSFTKRYFNRFSRTGFKQMISSMLVLFAFVSLGSV